MRMNALVQYQQRHREGRDRYNMKPNKCTIIITYDLSIFFKPSLVFSLKIYTVCIYHRNG